MTAITFKGKGIIDKLILGKVICFTKTLDGQIYNTIQYLIDLHSRYLNPLGHVGFDDELLVAVGDGKAVFLTASPSHAYHVDGERAGATVLHTKHLGHLQWLRMRTNC